MSFNTNLGIGGGFKVCFDNPFKEDLKKCGKELPKFSKWLNGGAGQYTGISTNNEKICINIGISASLLPVWISIPLTPYGN